ncbi:hypothetical protein TNCV_386461 [Trichonephila clavipes]|nr:hypothetical protein TNCV_386461 [Trichonephila clavipes]
MRQGISDRSVRRIAKTELGLKPYKRKVELLTKKTNSVECLMATRIGSPCEGSEKTHSHALPLVKSSSVRLRHIRPFSRNHSQQISSNREERCYTSILRNPCQNPGLRIVHKINFHSLGPSECIWLWGEFSSRAWNIVNDHVRTSLPVRFQIWQNEVSGLCESSDGYPFLFAKKSALSFSPKTTVGWYPLKDDLSFYLSQEFSTVLQLHVNNYSHYNWTKPEGQK